MIVAPFLGEFGWEVALWVPWLRWMRKHHHTGSEFVVYCKLGHGELYNDFASKVVEIVTPKTCYVDCQNAWVEGVKLRAGDYVELVFAHIEKKKPARKQVLTPFDLQVDWEADGPPHLRRAEWFNYRLSAKREPEDPADWVMLHARHCDAKQPERNWPIGQWNGLCDALLERGAKLSLMGSQRDSWSINRATRTYRGASIGSVIEGITDSKVVVGPSSGPLHLANLCGVPVVWWSQNNKDVIRYHTDHPHSSNPFKCNNVQADDSWDPPVDKVLEALSEWLG